MSDKYEREIEEIVGRSGGDIGPRTPFKEVFRDYQRRLREGFSLQLPSIFGWVTPTRVGGFGAILLVVGLFAKQPYLVLPALTLLLGAYLLSVVRGGRSFEQTTGHDKTWRGEPMDIRQPSRWKSRFWRWFGKKD